MRGAWRARAGGPTGGISSGPMHPPNIPKAIPTAGPIAVACSAVRKSVPLTMPAPVPTSAHIPIRAAAAKGLQTVASRVHSREQYRALVGHALVRARVLLLLLL